MNQSVRKETNNDWGGADVIAVSYPAGVRGGGCKARRLGMESIMTVGGRV